MKKVKSPLTGKFYRKNTKIEEFFLYKIIYPVVNNLGINRWFNLLRHRMGMYDELPNGLCKWCGYDHNFTPLSGYKERTIEQLISEVDK